MIKEWSDYYAWCKEWGEKAYLPCTLKRYLWIKKGVVE